MAIARVCELCIVSLSTFFKSLKCERSQQVGFEEKRAFGDSTLYSKSIENAVKYDDTAEYIMQIAYLNGNDAKVAGVSCIICKHSCASRHKTINEGHSVCFLLSIRREYRYDQGNVGLLSEYTNRRGLIEQMNRVGGVL